MLSSSAVTQIYCVHSTHMGLPKSSLRDLGDIKNHHEYEAHGTCCAMGNKIFVSDPGDSCLFPATMKLCQANTLDWK